MTFARIRMFRQGLGDSFLLTFPGDAADVNVLIDFGVLLGTPDAKKKMQAMALDIVKATNGKLDYLVATHEHWDHVSGFAQAEDELAKEKLTVGEVWVAWTEKPGEPLAEELRGRRAAALTRLKSAANRLGAAGEPGPRKTAKRLVSMLEFFGGIDGIGAAGRPTTKNAMDWVKDRTAPKLPQYLFPGQVFDLKGAKGVRVYVLGPPYDRKWIKKSNPTKSASEVYELAAADGSDFGLFAALDALDDGVAPAGQPFDEWFRLSETDVKGHPFFTAHYEHGEPWRKIEHDWLGSAGALALQLDSDTNNTSLVLAFELVESGRVLLFPADAQVGNWLSWNEIEWSVQNGVTLAKGAQRLLENTVFYKIGHHGSHNATLRALGLERMNDAALVAMLPLDRPTAQKMEWNMPFPSLYDELQKRCKGRILDLELGMPAKPPGLVDAEWAAFTANVDVQPGWIDYKVSMD